MTEVAEEHRGADDAEQQHERVRRPSARVASAVSDSVPPSPLLSARSSTSTYLIVTTTISAHTISDSTPSTVSRRHRAGFGRRHHRDAEGVERARADVAVDDADAAERQRPDAPLGMRLGDGRDHRAAGFACNVSHEIEAGFGCVATSRGGFYTPPRPKTTAPGCNCWLAQ